MIRRIAHHINIIIRKTKRITKPKRNVYFCKTKRSIVTPTLYNINEKERSSHIIRTPFFSFPGHQYIITLRSTPANPAANASYGQFVGSVSTPNKSSTICEARYRKNSAIHPNTTHGRPSHPAIWNPATHSMVIITMNNILIHFSAGTLPSQIIIFFIRSKLHLIQLLSVSSPNLDCSPAICQKHPH